MDDRLRQAIALIQSGKGQSGARLLAEVVQADPENEIAWLWMSGVVHTDEQRIDCLEQVLRINPGNEAAREGLAALRATRQAAPEMPPTPSEPGPPPREAGEAPVSPVKEAVEPLPDVRVEATLPPIAEEPAGRPVPSQRVWLNPGDRTNQAVVLYDDIVVAANPDDQVLKQLESEPEAGLPPREALGEEVAAVHLDRITLVTANQRTCTISLRHTENGRPAVETIYFADSRDRDRFFDALEARLGENFQRSVRESNLLQTIVAPLVVLAVILAATLLCHGTARGIVAGAEMPSIGGRRILLWLFFSSLLSLIGPTGVLSVGILLALAVVAWGASRVMRPSALMTLAPAGRQTPAPIPPEPVAVEEVPSPTVEGVPSQEEAVPQAGEERPPFLSERVLLLLAILAALLLAVAAFASRYLLNRPLI